MNDSKMQIFATRLKELRTDNGMTQKEFAQKIGVTPAALSAYENNQKNMEHIHKRTILKVYFHFHSHLVYSRSIN